MVKILDSRDINDLHMILSNKCERHMINCSLRGVEVTLISTLRDDAYQATLYAQGRTTPGNIVTNSPLTGAHGLGLAYDVVPIDKNGNAIWNSATLWKVVGEEGMKLNLVWGGNWKSFNDSAHFELTDGLKYSDLREGKRPAWFNYPSFMDYVQYRTGFEGQTIQFLDAYKYADPLFNRFAELL